MKLKLTLLAATLTTFAASTSFAAADDAHDPGAKSVIQKAEKAEAKKPVKKHSHMEEKTGMPMPEPASGVEKQDSMKQMDMHDHTKDRH